MHRSGIYGQRLQELKKIGKQEGIQAFLVSSETNMRYFAGFSLMALERFAGIFIPVENGDPIVVVPRLEEAKVKETSAFKAVSSYSDSESPRALLSGVIKQLGLKKAVIGVEGTLLFRFFEMLNACASRLKAVDASSCFSRLRVIKSEEELRIMEKASDVLATGIRTGTDFIEPGVSELSISCEIERAIKQNGGESIPFCIILSGPNTALPHGQTSTRKVGTKDIVLMDVGAVCEGYYADLTRTVFVGDVTKEQKKIYGIVAQAQEAAIRSVKPGIKVEEIDRAARTVIKDAGYGRYFTHRTGHGLGLDVHEEPYVAEGNQTILESGMTFTIEPGIYFFGKFGIRIEDNIAVTRTKGKIFGSLSKELTVK